MHKRTKLSQNIQMLTPHFVQPAETNKTDAKLLQN
uniref:Uncharacterized protein n=1 Tax=Ackermannviridae sp. TaxID=2831612 RepID=A0A8S5RTK3_9CAUD|nr:MAG TPA: hypothetical protein [Ackermannviridae sp.]